MKRLWRILLLGVGCGCAQAEGGLVIDPYQALAQNLARYVASNVVEVAVGNFLYEDSQLMSPFSSVLREELERVLPQTGKFKVKTRQRMNELRDEAQFQEANEPGAGLRGLRDGGGVKALVRGRFYYKYPEVTVFAELAWLGSEEVQKAKVVLPAAEVSSRIWPDTARTQQLALDTVINPQSAVASRVNVADVEKRLAKVARDFHINLVVNEGKRDFAEGETISYRVQSATGCHVAIFCHQVDGSTVLLFPNEFQRDTWVPAGTGLEIPVVGKDQFQFKIQPPFGADVVQVIACTKPSALHHLLQQQAAQITKGMGVRGIERGIVVEGLTNAMAVPGQPDDSNSPTRWGEAHIVVCTYPKYGQPSR
jgi:hypothetical protein